jgi:hypothetical protein
LASLVTNLQTSLAVGYFSFGEKLGDLCLKVDELGLVLSGS